ncbi:M20/M25/M40 family metallo-hydrolase [Aegicerativicinus sediminis]|uniref:M20/M25/M40 family metallo-hydrolase n=1 Tax=Aegicerativicinus sediminis TaxID=2893202 RepID=UPI001E2B88D8|nr:M20/M25/M40 family metallo-hydrolase [Aegicerativicinus sediminis]
MLKLNSTVFLSILFSVLALNFTFSQSTEEMAEKIVEEATNNSQLEILAHELLDDIGPRLVGTPQMKQANDWAVAKYASWGIQAENQKWGEWRGWERGITHVDLLEPRIQSLNATQLAWSPAAPKKGITAECVIMPIFKNSSDFNSWLPSIKGKIVLASMEEPTGRPDENWEEYAVEKDFEKMKTERDSLRRVWRQSLNNTGYNFRTIYEGLEKAGAAAIATSYWSNAFGASKIFSARTKEIPTINIAVEDYGMLYRMAEHGDKPVIKIIAESKDLGIVPNFNTIGKIEGTEKPNEFVILSAHFDSWDGGTGATDNGTGTLVMMETMRILKKLYPNPKRTILVGHWGSEEQGLNGSRAFVEDHPEIVANVQVVLNQDNGTGRVEKINGSGFLNSYAYLGKWLNAVPDEIKNNIETEFPGSPSGGGSDHSSFIAANAPAFFLSSLSWSYGNYTWHTNLDTYDKIVFEDVKRNVILTAILAYMASEDPEKTSRERSVLPISRRTGEQMKWPEQRSPQRKGGVD